MAQRLNLNSTMQDLLNLVLHDRKLSETRRRNLASSIRSFIKYLGLDLHMQADFPTYRGHLKRFNLGSAPISRARWANIVSDVKFALQKYGARTRTPSRDDLHPEWRKLVPCLDSLRLQRGLRPSPSFAVFVRRNRTKTAVQPR